MISFRKFLESFDFPYKKNELIVKFFEYTKEFTRTTNWIFAPLTQKAANILYYRSDNLYVVLAKSLITGKSYYLTDKTGKKSLFEKHTPYSQPWFIILTQTTMKGTPVDGDIEPKEYKFLEEECFKNNIEENPLAQFLQENITLSEDVVKSLKEKAQIKVTDIPADEYEVYVKHLQDFCNEVKTKLDDSNYRRKFVVTQEERDLFKEFANVMIIDAHKIIPKFLQFIENNSEYILGKPKKWNYLFDTYLSMYLETHLQVGDL